MISREEYNKALDIVEAFQKQLFIAGGGRSLRTIEKTPLLEWGGLQKCSIRLKNGLWAYMAYFKKYENQHVFFLEDISIKDFRKTRSVGEQSLKEFIELRGY